MSSLLSGPVAVIAQSGGLGFALLGDGQARRLGFAYVVSTGNEDGLSALDYVEYMMSDPSVRVIALFLEGLHNADKLEVIAERAIATGKHLVIAKAGSSRLRSAASRIPHTLPATTPSTGPPSNAMESRRRSIKNSSSTPQWLWRGRRFPAVTVSPS